MAGADLTEEMLAQLDRAHSRIFLLGGSEKEIQGTRRGVRGRFAGSQGVGGTFSFVSGSVSRAPRWLRRVGLEWLYRLLRQPWRVRRQLAIPKFVCLVVRERLRMARRGRGESRAPP